MESRFAAAFGIVASRVLERRPKVASPSIGGCLTEDVVVRFSRLSVLQSRDHPFIPSPLSFVSTTILDACSRRGSIVGGERLWMTQVMGNVGQQVMLPHPRWTSLQWGFIYETRCRPAKDISTDVRMGSRCTINAPIMNDLVRMLFQEARSQWDFDWISRHKEITISCC